MSDKQTITINVNIDETEFKIAEAWLKRLTNDVDALANAYARLELTANYARHAVNNAPTGKMEGRSEA